MTIPGSVDNGEVDVEYSPDHRQSAQELWFRACDKRISALELQVHRLLNPTDDENARELGTYMRGYINGRESATEQHGKDYELGYADGKAAVTRTEGDYVHVPGAIWEDMIDELATARATRATMDSDGVLLSHDAYDMLEREAAIGRSVPWKSIANSVGTSMAFVGGPNDVVEWLDTYAPKEAAE